MAADVNYIYINKIIFTGTRMTKCISCRSCSISSALAITDSGPYNIDKCYSTFSTRRPQKKKNK